MNDDILRLAELFFVPISILAGALAVAETDQLKTGLSFAGFIFAGMWTACECLEFEPYFWLESPTTQIISLIPVLLCLAALVSTIVHARAWWKN